MCRLLCFWGQWVPEAWEEQNVIQWPAYWAGLQGRKHQGGKRLVLSLGRDLEQVPPSLAISGRGLLNLSLLQALCRYLWKCGGGWRLYSKYSILQAILQGALRTSQTEDTDQWKCWWGEKGVLFLYVTASELWFIKKWMCCMPSLWKIHVVVRKKEIQNLLSDLCPLLPLWVFMTTVFSGVPNPWASDWYQPVAC